MGITLADLRISGKIPVVKQRLKILTSGFEISDLIRFSAVDGILAGPLAFLSSRLSKHSRTSWLEILDKYKEWGFGFFKKFLKFLEDLGIPFLMFSAIDVKKELNSWVFQIGSTRENETKVRKGKMRQ